MQVKADPPAWANFREFAHRMEGREDARFLGHLSAMEPQILPSSLSPILESASLGIRARKISPEGIR